MTVVSSGATIRSFTLLGGKKTGGTAGGDERGQGKDNRRPGGALASGKRESQ